MRPTIDDGRSVLINPRAYRHRAVQPDDIVLVEHPHRPGLVMVKRVLEAVDSEVIVVGDNPAASTDSRHFGSLPRSGVLGRVECFFV